MSKTFRFKFSEEINDKLSNFGRLYSYANNEDLKSYWENWLNENEEVIINENNRLIELGYKGNINDKLYKSVKYYWIKVHKLENVPNNEIDINNKNQTYIIINNKLLEKINNHVNEIIINNISPKEGYDIFLKENEEFINTELNEMKKCLKFLEGIKDNSVN